MTANATINVGGGGATSVYSGPSFQSPIIGKFYSGARVRILGYADFQGGVYNIAHIAWLSGTGYINSANIQEDADIHNPSNLGMPMHIQQPTQHAAQMSSTLHQSAPMDPRGQAPSSLNLLRRW